MVRRLGRVESQLEIFGDDAELSRIMAERHVQIDSSIVENWGFEEQVSQAIANYGDPWRDTKM